MLQHVQIRPAGLVQPAQLVQEHALAEPQLGVAREESPAAAADRQRLLAMVQPHLGVDQECVRLPQVRFLGIRPRDAPLQVVGGLRELRCVRMRHPQVEEGERVLGPLGQLEPQQPHIADALPLLCRRPGIRPRMHHVDVGPGHLAPESADRRQDLLVDPPVEPHVGPVGEQLDVVDDRDVRVAVAGLASSRAVNLHHVPQHPRIGMAVDQAAQPPPALGRDRVVGVHPEHPFPARMPERLVPRGGEIVAPGEMEEPSAVRLDDPRRLIDRAGIHDHHLVDPGADTLQAGRQRPGRVAHDHAERETGPRRDEPQAPSRSRFDHPFPRPGRKIVAGGRARR